MVKRSYISDHQGHPHYFSDEKILEFRQQTQSLNLDDLTLILKQLSDPTKLKIYSLLSQVEEIPVTDICHVLDMNQSTVSHALSDLKLIGLVDCKQCGQLRCYYLLKQTKARRKILNTIINQLK